MLFVVVVVFFLLIVFSLNLHHTGIHKKYRICFMIPYFIFVRDSISYLALLALHSAICLEPSQLSLSGLEWTILCFLVGRLLTEIRQIKDILKQKRDITGERRERVDTHLIYKAPGVELIENYIRYSVYYPFNSGCTNRTYGYELSYLHYL